MKELKISSAEIRGLEPMPEPTRRGNRQTRVPEILEVAIRVFAAEGGSGFTQRRVASEAGIRLSTLQHYFGTREELLKSTIEEVAKRYVTEYREIARDKTRPPEARLDRIVDNVFSNLASTDSPVGAFALHVWSLAEHERFAHEMLEEVQREFIELFAGLVAKLNPSLPSSECTLRGGMIDAHMLGLIVFVRRGGDIGPDRESLRVATKAVWKALSLATQ